MKSRMQEAFEAALIAKVPDYHQPGIELGVLTSATVHSRPSV
jgi:hypothetical protein